MTLKQYRVILDAIEYKEGEWLKRLDREPVTRGGKRNPIKAMYIQDLSDLSDAKLAFQNAGIEWTPEPE